MIYLHIPFCNYICKYCDFPKFYHDKVLVNKYLDALEKEVTRANITKRIETIYIGGGTPSSLCFSDLERVLKLLRKYSDNVIEYTVEVNPDCDEEKLILLKKYGVNRLSVGIQTFNNEILKEVLRKESKVNFIHQASKYFDNISIDLIYGLPTQKLEDIKRDLDIVEKNKELIKHLSYYSLILEDNTRLVIEGFKGILEEEELEMEDYLIDRLIGLGYQRYEVSNYAKAGYESLHNSGYWNLKEYYGFGIGACSYLNNQRITNTRSISKYFSGDFRETVIDINAKEKMEEYIMLQMRMTKGINLKEFYLEFGFKLEEVSSKLVKLQENNLVTINNNYLFATRLGMRFLNQVIIDLLEN